VTLKPGVMMLNIQLSHHRNKLHFEIDNIVILAAFNYILCYM